MKIKKVRDMIKTRIPYMCYYCGERIPAGSYCFGKNPNYAKACISCQKK